MSDNLDLTQLVSNQNNKETTINDQNAEIDSAMTENLTKTVTSTNAATVTQAELQRAVFLQIDADGGDPPNAAITVTIDTAFKRGLFAVFNNTAEEVTVTISGQSATAPTIPAGVVRVVLLQGSDVLDAPGLTFASGTAGSPGMFFADDPDTGFYLKSDGTIGVVSGGVEVLEIAGDGISPSQPIILDNGSAAEPVIRFADEPNWGFFRTTTGVGGISISIDGAEVFRYNEIGSFALTQSVLTGTVSLPGFFFAGDTNTGFTQSGASADDVIVAAGGVEAARFTSQGILAPDGAELTPSITFASDPDTGFHRPFSAVVDLTLAGDNKVRFVGDSMRMFNDGTVSEPAFSWGVDPDTGIYRAGVNQLAIATGGIERLRIGSRIYSSLNGDLAAPAYSFDTDQDLGIYRVAVDTLGISAGGSEAARFTSQGLLAPQGSNLAPSISFAIDTDTGIYLESGNIMAFASNNIERFRMHGFSLRVGALGTETIPAYSFTADDNTGLFRPTDDILAISAGGSEKQRWDTTRSTIAQPLQYDSFTVGTLPVGAAGDNIFVTDETGGPVPAYHDGTNWRRYSDGAIVS